MWVRSYVSIACVLVLLSLAGAASAEPPLHTSLGVALGRDWFARDSADTNTPSASQIGGWLLRDLTPSFGVGLGATGSLFLFGCREEPGCFPYRLLRLSALSELRRQLVGNEHQALEIWGSLGPDVVRYARGENPTGATWGIGATARGGPRVRMRWLTIAPYAEFAGYSVGSHWAYGLGLQFGVRVVD